MIKVIDTDNYVFDELVASLVSDGPTIDIDSLTKRAAAEHIKEFKSVKPKKDHSLVHVIAMGASDFTGANRNADIFLEKAASLELPEADWKRITVKNGTSRTKSASTFADKTKTGLIDTYKTFETDGHVFKHHKNKPKRGDEIFGEVKMAAYNEPMHRVELLLELPNNKWKDELEKMANGQDTSWSMACIVDPETPILTEYGYLPIGMIEEGLQVLTHKRSWKTVTKTMKRKYTGWAYKIKTNVSPYTLFLTEDHPLLASFSKEHAKAYAGENGLNKEDYKKPHWNEVSNLTDSDSLQYLSPDFFNEYIAMENKDFAYAVGRIFGGDNVSDFEADMLSPFIGNEYGQKTLYAGLFNSSEEVKLCFIGGLLDSPNSVVAFDDITNDIDIFYLDVNRKAICEVRDLLASINIETEIIIDKATKENGEEVDLYKLDIPNSYFNLLEEYSGKLDFIDLEIEKPESFVGDSIDLYRPVSIQSIEKVWIEDKHVYNIEVEDDNSYLIDGIVSHNCNVEKDICTICGNAATKRGEYCDHVSSHLGDMTKEGHVVAVVNENPRFFDISKVGRNADRIAFSIEKVAGMRKLSGAEIAEEYDFSDHLGLKSAMLNTTDINALNKITLFKKLAEIEKQIDAKSVDVKSNPELKAVQKKTKEKIFKSCKGDMNKVSKCISRLAQDGIMLPLEKFAELFVEDESIRSKLVEETSQALKRGYNDNMDKMAEVANNKSFKIDKYVIDNSFDKLAKTVYRDLSFNSDAITDRVLERSLENEFKMEKQSNFEGEVSPAAKELCRQFMSYQLEYLNDQVNTQGKSIEKMAKLICLQNLT